MASSMDDPTARTSRTAGVHLGCRQHTPVDGRGSLPKNWLIVMARPHLSKAQMGHQPPHYVQATCNIRARRSLRETCAVPVHACSVSPMYSNTQMTRMTRLVMRIHDHPRALPKRLVRRDFVARESARPEVSHAHPCPILTSFSSEIGPLPGTHGPGPDGLVHSRRRSSNQPYEPDPPLSNQPARKGGVVLVLAEPQVALPLPRTAKLGCECFAAPYCDAEFAW
jgi:hypothetical protein